MPKKDVKKKPGEGNNAADGQPKKKNSKQNKFDPGPGGDADELSANQKKEDEEKVPVGPPEWDSETIRSANIFIDGFSSCVVLVMEDSPELTKYGEYLWRTADSGVRRRFICISGTETAERVKKFVVATGQRDSQAEEMSYMERQDLFAEAIKFSLLSAKEVLTAEMDIDTLAKEMELSGARSKEYVRVAPPIPLNSVLDENAEMREAPPAPPPSVNTPTSPLEQKKGKGKQSVDKNAENQTNALRQSLDGNEQLNGVKTQMRKRGEVQVPELKVIDEIPPKGPQSFVLLQGFYNPKIIEELRNIGIKVEGVLLMTDEKVNRYNFSILDVEDSVPGTFRPKIVLPQYLKAVEKSNRSAASLGSPVTKFWVALTEMYNSAPPDSYFHDIALINIKMPEMNMELQNAINTPEGLTLYVSKLYDDIAKRIYEMLTFEEWHQEFISAADVNQMQPLELSLPHDIYDKIIGQIPSECMSVSIILEALVQQVAHSLDKEVGLQVPEPCYDNDITQGLVMGKSNFGQTNWGVAAKPGQEMKNEGSKDEKLQGNPSLFMIPMYIKAGDYASIRSCHLNESLASKISACQLSGDMRNIQGFLWQNVPEFNRGLHMKLLGNLNHFLHFMPPNLIRFEDMFYILHLLMSAGIEIHLQKEAEKRREEEAAVVPEEMQQENVLASDVLEGEDRKFVGTNLSTDHNYFAVNLKSGVNYIITPDSSNTMTVASLGQSQPMQPDESPESIDIDQFLKETQEKLGAKEIDVQFDKDKKGKGKKSKQKKEFVDAGKVGRVATVGAIENAAEYAQTLTEYQDKQEMLDKKKTKKKKGKKGDKEVASQPDMKSLEAIGGPAGDAPNVEPVPSKWGITKGISAEQVMPEQSKPEPSAPTVKKSVFLGNDVPPPPQEQKEEIVQHVQKSGFENANPSKDKKKFIACEEEFFEDIQDVSVIQALLECPALLAIHESGALDLSKWVEKYLFSCGMEIGEGLSEGILLGDLKNWNFVEELVPIQTVQMLNEASQEYLSMQRMYCPFYDTLLFIFNNPMPTKMTAETNFYFKLNTLPGLQHFLEYTMNDQNVIKWIEQMESTKRLEMGESYSLQTLLSVIPEEQWILAPSIKYQIMVENANVNPFKPNSLTSASNVSGGNMDLAIEGNIVNAETGSVKSGTSHLTAASSARDALLGEVLSPPPTPNTTETEKSATEEPPQPQPSVRRNSKASTQKSKGKSRESASDKPSVKSANKKESKDGTGVSEGDKSRNSNEMGSRRGSVHSESVNAEKTLMQTSLNFSCYDLGKRIAVVGNDTFFLFPMDGTIIRYDISTIEPEFRMMQLSVSKNGHQTFFYPYYIPRDFDLSAEDYVVCPYFHMILNNGTIFAFQDSRAEEAAPYKIITKDKPQEKEDNVFTFEKVLFGKEVEKKLNEAATVVSETLPSPEATETRVASAESEGSGEGAEVPRKLSRESKKSGEKQEPTAIPEPVPQVPLEGKKTKKGLKEKKSKRNQKQEEKMVQESKNESENSEMELKKKKDKKKEKKGKHKAKETDAEVPVTPSPPPSGGMEDEEEEPDLVPKEGTEVGAEETPLINPNNESGLPEVNPLFEQGANGEWLYPSSDNSDDEAESTKRRLFFAPPWDEAAIIMQEMTHLFKVTLPSGLLIQIEDLPGPPVTRVVKQSYIGHGSARSQIESSRYYTMDGSAMKFLFNGNIQVLTARGVTTNIDELAANAPRDADNMANAFGSASVVKIFNGEVILPNGQHWDVSNGKKISKNPIYVFTSGPLSGGEVFRRRQDGMICLHRFDGTVITHYPDGTRFTTRMVISENYDTVDFEDWVFVGLKYMIEHPNYSTVLLNTLSGNVHLKLPYGEWVRVFADGNIRISTEDEYKFDVDSNRAILTYPSCLKGPDSLPNITSVRLWHNAVPGTQEEPAPQEQPDDAQKTSSQANLTDPQEGQNEEEETKAVETKEVENLKPMKKDKSRKTVQQQQQARSLHPKIKQREPNKEKKGRSRMSMANVGRKKSKSISPAPEAMTEAQTLPNDEATEDLESKEIDGVPSIPAIKTASSTKKLPTEVNEPNQEPVMRRKNSFVEDTDALQEFLRFTDETTFCKAVDSWDNRFLMNLYGASTVDKMEIKKEETTDKLLSTLAQHSNMPKKYLAGILKNTSSANLEKAAKRFQALKTNSKNVCDNGLPKTKIFVVKRDLTGFQYLQKSQVDDIVTKAYGSKESMVIVDPLPHRQPRKFVTVMRPVEEVEDPHGMWTRPYIEPMFRPRAVTNKHLTVANPNDLRWFGYILNSAHNKRPKFVLEPKQVYKEMREKALKEQQQHQQEAIAETEELVEDIRKSVNILADSQQVDDNSMDRSFDEEEENGEEEEEDDEEMQDNNNEVNRVDEDDKKKKKKDKKDKDKEAKKKKKGKNDNKTSPGNSDEEEEEMEEVEVEVVASINSLENQKADQFLDEEPEIEEYPDLDDILGIYEAEAKRLSQAPKIKIQHHSPPCNTKKAIVVRAFVEIPKVDENIQRALLAASMSYSETCKAEAALYGTYKTEDPRSPEEKKAQTEYKQQLIEHNIEEMHLLEQKPGPVLRFNF